MVGRQRQVAPQALRKVGVGGEEAAEGDEVGVAAPQDRLGARANEVADVQGVRRKPALEADDMPDTGVPGQLGKLLRDRAAHRQRPLAIDVLAGRDGGTDRVGMLRGGVQHQHHVDVG